MSCVVRALSLVRFLCLRTGTVRPNLVLDLLGRRAPREDGEDGEEEEEEGDEDENG